MADAAAAAEKKMLTLQSSDKQLFQVEEAVGMRSQTIKHMIEDDCASNVIPLLNVTGSTLAKVIEYCTKHVAAEGPAGPDGDLDPASKDAVDGLKKFDADFVNVEQPVLFDLILAANYLDIKELLDLTCQTVADMIKGKSPEEIRKTFNIKNDFTEEEEAEIRKENQWAFE